jgi:hypothetical protein
LRSPLSFLDVSDEEAEVGTAPITAGIEGLQTNANAWDDEEEDDLPTVRQADKRRHKERKEKGTAQQHIFLHYPCPLPPTDARASAH